ncbi:M20/M25/M40 family metallo-hydrolase [Demequina mangrovi]|uniref:Acetylornithine deacetylase/Succinyl-diaminopimelate desuccinylase n=1 Tax=Demequina mangrovi TaxID=1043493 RepID=A0A1H6XJ24_9MICO|nr:M20/M25/M40 family metallo-hydrolase [Demequina mangrovi]SEJ24872.1 Acetylornithine deacetylase/Succinyl-diaminopimelate desuccinylase [Demequina mangrovi]
MPASSMAAKVRDLMPGVIADLEELISIPSVAFPGYPEEPVNAMASRTLELVREAGFADARLMDVPWGYPPIYGEIPGPAGSPTVVLYAHYDVQPAAMSQGWTSEPFTPTRKDDGRIYGRGAADDKSGIATHLGTLRAFGGEPPCTLRIILEGMEETESNLEEFVEAHPDLFQCDLFVVCDMGNLVAGEPVLTTALRGDVSCKVTVRTLDHPLHSGVFGGAAPDAMMALARLLTSLVDDAGDVAVAGVTGGSWAGAVQSEESFLEGCPLLPGVSLVGTGTISDRLWAKPSINAIGVDITSIADSSNVIHPAASAKISMRIVPGTDPEAELDALVAHLETHAPWGAQVAVERVKAAPAFLVPGGGAAVSAAREAMAEAFGMEVSEVGSGGSIPLLQTLHEACPTAEFVLWGPEDMELSRIHASDESVDPAEIERMVVAQALLLEKLGAQG